jgi:NDP-sugar pyrophosphorylase family protein
MLPVIILAGGLATRLRPITETIPKSMINICGKPFVDYQLKYLSSQGIKKALFCVGYLGEQIESYVGDGSLYGLEVDYSYDGDSLLGTGGAIKKCLNNIENEFFILYGDSFLPIPFQDVFSAYKSLKKPGLMTVLRNQDRWDVSNVIFEDEILIEYNKKKRSDRMHYIDYGLNILTKTIFESYPVNYFFDLADLYYDLSISGNLSGYEVHERFYEIGSIDGIKETEIYFSNLKKGVI